MPVPKVPAYGDANRLTQLASGLKRQHGTYGAIVQRNEPGRPTGSGQAASQEQGIPGEHAQGAKSVAQAEWSRQFWAMMAERYPDDPRVQMFAANSSRVADELANSFYAQTPNFER